MDCLAQSNSHAYPDSCCKAHTHSSSDTGSESDADGNPESHT
jgi:hypothetical protein